MPMFAFIPWLAGVFGSIVAWFTTWLAKRWALRAAIITSIIAITVAFTLTINGIIAGIVYAAPSGWYKVGLSLLPTNYTGCLGAYVAAHVTRWVYDYKMGFMARWLDAGL